MNRQSSRRQWSDEMRNLADLAGSFTLPIRVNVGQDLGQKQNGQNRQGQSQCSDEVALRLLPANHIDSLHYPNLFFDAIAVPW